MAADDVQGMYTWLVIGLDAIENVLPLGRATAADQFCEVDRHGG